MKKIIYLGICLSFVALTSCGGNEETTNNVESDTTATEEKVIEKTTMTYTVDSSASTINWKGYESPSNEDSFHFGTVSVLDGNFEVTTENDVNSVTAGSLTFDMNSIKSGEDLAKLEGHLKAPDYFDVNQFAKATFNVTGFENGSLMGTLMVVNTELNVSAPATVDVTEGIATVSVEEFRIDLTPASMPFFVADAELPADEQHDPKIGVNATIVGM